MTRSTRRAVTTSSTAATARTISTAGTGRTSSASSTRATGSPSISARGRRRRATRSQGSRTSSAVSTTTRSPATKPRTRSRAQTAPTRSRGSAGTTCCGAAGRIRSMTARSTAPTGVSGPISATPRPRSTAGAVRLRPPPRRSSRSEGSPSESRGRRSPRPRSARVVGPDRADAVVAERERVRRPRVLVEVERRGERRGLAVAMRELVQAPVVLDEAQDARELAELAADEPVLRVWADDHERDADPEPVAVHLWRRDVVVEAAVVVPREEDRRRVPLGRAHDRVDHLRRPVLAVAEVPFGVLAQLEPRGDPRDRRQQAVRDVPHDVVDRV